MKNSKIEWTDHTFNPWQGCTKVSPGCAHCYAEARDQRFTGGQHWGKGAPRQRTTGGNWRQPLKWNAESRMEFEHHPRVFCASLADWLDDEVPIDWTADLLDLIRRTPNLDWQLLTKRPENWVPRIKAVMDHLSNNAAPDAKDALWSWLVKWALGEPPENVWIGTTVEDQQRADERIPELLKIPAWIRFLSCEPLLGPIEFSDVKNRRDAVQQLGKKALAGINWVICGGESGPHARPMHPDWARSLRDQCRTASMPFFFKQWGEWAPYEPVAGGNLGGDVRSGRVAIVHPTGQTDVEVFEETHGRNTIPGSRYMARVGKHAAGRLLDGREWNEFP